MMMNVNMQAIYKAAEGDSGELPSELAEIVAEGFVREGNNIFLKALFRRTGPLANGSFIDEVGAECYVNHLHIDADCHGNAVAIALSFLLAVGHRWKAQCGSGTLRTILSVDDDASCTFRCHIVRRGQSWVNEDLDTYTDAAILVDDF